jgi:hypothetical protein
MNNYQQLGLTWSMYAGDNNERLVSNNDMYPTPGADKSKSWVCPYGVALDWTSNAKNFNTLYLTVDDPMLGTALLGSYVSKSLKIFVCPADNKLSSAQAGTSNPNRIRTCAMNGAMGDGVKYFAPPNPGNWTAFYNVKKSTDMHTPGPSDCFVILDEHPNSDDDASIYVNPADANGNGTAFTELPGSLHGGGSGMVFGDGHSEVHVWKGTQTIQKFDPNRTSYLQAVGNLDAISQKDLTWFAQHTPQN